MVDNIPRVLAGRYEVGELIGRGGMAEVHIGYDSRLSRTVAIKLLRSDLAEDPTFHARFRREAQSAAALNHPAIVAVYDTGEETTTDAVGKRTTIPFIVMEYVEGHTVRELLKDGAAVPIDEALEIIVGVLGALEYSHNEGIVHRDIKPGNVMLTPTGQVKVMDFGIARAMSDQQATMTATNSVVGTAQYLSPEQARGEVVDHRSDLYSTGCVLFELLTGQPPFSGDSAVSVAYQHVREVPPVPSTIAGDIPDVLDRVVMKSLAKERDERYADANQMRADLLAVLHGGNVDAPAPTAWLPVGGLGAPTASTTPLRATTPRPPRVRAIMTRPRRACCPTTCARLALVVGAGDPRPLRGRRDRVVVLNQDELLAIPSPSRTWWMDAGDGVRPHACGTLTSGSTAGEEPSEEYEAGQAIRSDPAVDAEVEAAVHGRCDVLRWPGGVRHPGRRGLRYPERRCGSSRMRISRSPRSSSRGRRRHRARSRVADRPGRRGAAAEPGDSVIPYVATGRGGGERRRDVRGGALDWPVESPAHRAQLQPAVEHQDAGNVVSMDPGPGTVDVGSTISIVISTGPTEPEPTQEPEPTTNPNQPTDVPTGPGENNGNP